MPKNIFKLDRCGVETLNIPVPTSLTQTWGFNIVDQESGTNIALVANSLREFEVWFQFLTINCGHGLIQNDVESVGTKSDGTSLVLHQAVEDIIADYFFMNAGQSPTVSYFINCSVILT